MVEQVRLCWQSVVLADKAGSDTIPDAAGGERGHGITRTKAFGPLGLTSGRHIENLE